jgi:hypothetical protein
MPSDARSANAAQEQDRLPGPLLRMGVDQANARRSANKPVAAKAPSNDGTEEERGDASQKRTVHGHLAPGMNAQAEIRVAERSCPTEAARLAGPAYHHVRPMRAIARAAVSSS